jgi:GTP-binding protein
VSQTGPRAARVELVGAVGAPGQQAPSSLPQIAIGGRSNVGKSTLINKLVGRKKLARTSKRPGRTQEINFFQVDERFLLADLPGYGFATAPPDVRERWGPLIESYLGESERLLGIVFLIDARHGLSPDDRHMLEYLERTALPTLFVLTKVDKVGRSQRNQKLERIARELGASEDQLLATSARTGEGLQILWDSILALVQEGEQG